MHQSRKNGHVAADILRTGLSVITTNSPAVITSVTFRGNTCNWNVQLFRIEQFHVWVTYLKIITRLFFTLHTILIPLCTYI